MIITVLFSKLKHIGVGIFIIAVGYLLFPYPHGLLLGGLQVIWFVTSLVSSLDLTGFAAVHFRKSSSTKGGRQRRAFPLCS